MKVSGSDPTRRSRGGRRHSGAPGGGVPRKARGHLHRGAKLRWCAKRRSAPSRCEGKGKRRRRPPRRTTSGADESRLYECERLHGAILKTESEMSARSCYGFTLQGRVDTAVVDAVAN